MDFLQQQGVQVKVIPGIILINYFNFSVFYPFIFEDHNHTLFSNNQLLYTMYYFSVTSIRCKCFRHLINSYNYQRKKTKKEKEKEAINAVNHSGYTSICDAVND